jgi:hypothetical protein
MNNWSSTDNQCLNDWSSLWPKVGSLTFRAPKTMVDVMVEKTGNQILGIRILCRRCTRIAKKP